jgi:hypothetical protein
MQNFQEFMSFFKQFDSACQSDNQPPVREEEARKMFNDGWSANVSMAVAVRREMVNPSKVNMCR